MGLPPPRRFPHVPQALRYKAFHSVSLFIAILAVVTVLTLVVSPIATAQALQAQQGASVSAITSASDVPLFLPAVTYSSGGFEPGLIAVTDVNRDGKADDGRPGRAAPA